MNFINSNKIKKIPLVSVLMSVFNGEKYLKKAIESILNQSFKDFEFLIINDGSTDKSEEIIKSYDDSRIKLINNNKNLNLANSLNKGIGLAKGKYIARMDADDISLPDRLKIQVNFMDKNPKIGLCGTWIKTIENKSQIKKFPADLKKMKARLFFKNTFAHSSIIIQKKFFIENKLYYNPKFTKAQDYELWNRCINFFPCSNIQKTLLLYRVNSANNNEQIKNSKKVKNSLLKQNLNIISTKEELIMQQNVFKQDQYTANDFLNKKGKWFLKLLKQNNKIQYYEESEFSEVLSRIWFNACCINMDPAFKLWRMFFKFPLHKGWNFRDYRFILKCFLNRVYKNIKYIAKIILSFFSKITQFFSNIKSKKIMGKIDIASDNKKGITIIILSFNRRASLKKLLRSLLQQNLNNLDIEIIICNNYNKINLKKSNFTKTGRLLKKFSNLKILNSSYNWRDKIRYSLAIISKYETIFFIDDDIFLKDNNFVQYMYNEFQKIRDIDILSCWNTIWTKYDNDKYFKFTRINFIQPNTTKKIIETDTCGTGICMFNKKILYRQKVFEKSPKYPYADDMVFPIILNLEMGGKNYYLPSFNKLAFHRNANKNALCKVKKHYGDLYSYYKELYHSGYTPVIEKNPKSKEYVKDKKEKKYFW